MKRALTIAGSDPCGGAGIQADLKTFWGFGVYGLSVITSVTAQNTAGVWALHPLPARFVARQIDTILSDIELQAVKTGMLHRRSIVKVVSQCLKRHKVQNLVVDPVMTATSGATLLEPQAVELLKTKLIPLAKVVTPNLFEAQILAGTKSVETSAGMKRAAEKLWELGPEFVLVKGGHLEDQAVDILFDGNRFREFRAEKVSLGIHGTGCVFSAAITAGLSQGWDVPEAVEKAKEFITKAIGSSIKLGNGQRVININTQSALRR